MASEQVLSILAADNLDVACAAIEKAAMERAVSDVDEGFATSYEVRRRHREVSFMLFCHFVYIYRTSVITYSCAMVNRFGTHQHLNQISPLAYLTHFKSSQMGCNLTRPAYTKTSVRSSTF